MATPLNLQVFTSGPQALSATSSLVSGARDAVLIDAQFTLSEAHRLAALIYDTGKRLRTIYITHGHPDHYFGLMVLTQAFPGARAVTAPEVLEVINETAAAKVAQWKPLYGDNIPAEPVLPEALKGDVIELEGEELRILHVGQGDAGHSTVVWIPSIRAVVTGDVTYNGAHVWTAETDADGRKRWLNSLEEIEALRPVTVVAGHKTPGRDDGPSVITETRQYLRDFDAARARARNADELIAAMSAAYGDRALPIILEIGAKAAFGTS